MDLKINDTRKEFKYSPARVGQVRADSNGRLVLITYNGNRTSKEFRIVDLHNGESFENSITGIESTYPMVLDTVLTIRS
ncbi:hypothetical protein ETI06_05760 [Macrococcoides goetzii]|nr:hypothetical protein [Macrococcus goetzii]TDM49979.1 hypothetical protein ETI06_05760 [Macrococcus goetzii]